MGPASSKEAEKRFEEGARAGYIRLGKDTPAQFSVEWIGRVSPVFLTSDVKLVGTLSSSIEAVTGKTPVLSTGGGTSDARFIKDYCPVVEFGLVGQTMHKIDECTPLSDLEVLTSVYLKFLHDYFGSSTT